MRKPFTHTAVVVHPKTGKRKNVKCYEGVLTWVAGKHECYSKQNGARAGSLYKGAMAMMDLSTLKKIEVDDV